MWPGAANPGSRMTTMGVLLREFWSGGGCLVGKVMFVCGASVQLTACTTKHNEDHLLFEDSSHGGSCSSPATYLESRECWFVITMQQLGCQQGGQLFKRSSHSDCWVTQLAG